MLSLWQDLRPLYAGRCQYYSKSATPPEVRAGSAVSCQGTSLVQVEELLPGSCSSVLQVCRVRREWEAEPGLGAGRWQHSKVGSCMYCLNREGANVEESM